MYAPKLPDVQPLKLSDVLLALAVACRDVDVRNVKAVIIGPHDSPYEFGFFEVGVPIIRRLCTTVILIQPSSPSSSRKVSHQRRKVRLSLKPL